MHVVPSKLKHEAWTGPMNVDVADEDTDSVPVAVILDDTRSPVKYPLPATDRACEGDVEPMPTLPER